MEEGNNFQYKSWVIISVIKDVLGREFLDFLGGYGMMDLGWSHPDVINTVKAQLERSPGCARRWEMMPLKGATSRASARVLRATSAAARAHGA